MKRYLLLLMASLLLLSVQAQEAEEEHMQFMGISMGLPIKEFHKQLKKKGSKIEDKFPGIWSYNGTFANNNAKFTVYFNDKSKLISQILVAIPCYKEDLAIETYKTYCGIIEKKYSDDKGVQIWKYLNEQNAEEIEKGKFPPLEWKGTKTQDGVESTFFYIPRPTSDEPLKLLGIILVKPNKDMITYRLGYENHVQIVYYDSKNQKINNQLNNLDF